MGGGGEDRTEAATPKKRQELRRRGSVAKSQDLSSIIVFMGVLMVLHASGGAMVGKVQEFLRVSLSGLGDASLSAQTLSTIGTRCAFLLLQAVGPVMATALVLGVVVNGVQTGFLFSTQAMKPDFTRLNPLTGVQRFFSARGFVETAKAMAKLAIIGYIAYATISGSYPQMLETMRKDIPAFTGFVGDLLYRLTMRISMFLFVLAAADYAYQRYSFEKSIRMTKQEVKEEGKQQEGNPQIKGRIRARMRQLARRRMMEDVPKADVVLTNPTHFAVALKYDAGSMGAPRVVAKGADILAAKIRELAREHDVPIVENPPLARALYKTVEVGHEIPADFYGAVAEVLAFVYQINQRRAGRV